MLPALITHGGAYAFRQEFMTEIGYSRRNAYRASAGSVPMRFKL
jgi:hypothetical protein